MRCGTCAACNDEISQPVDQALRRGAHSAHRYRLDMVVNGQTPHFVSQGESPPGMLHTFHSPGNGYIERIAQMALLGLYCAYLYACRNRARGDGDAPSCRGGSC